MYAIAEWLTREEKERACRETYDHRHRTTARWESPLGVALRGSVPYPCPSSNCVAAVLLKRLATPGGSKTRSLKTDSGARNALWNELANQVEVSNTDWREGRIVDLATALGLHEAT